MKKRSTIFYLVILTFLVAGLTAYKLPIQKQNDFIILKTIESTRASQTPSVLLVSMPDGSVETTQLQITGPSNVDHSVQNLKTIAKKIGEIKGLGYELSSMSSGGGIPGGLYTTYYFKKP